MDEHQLLIDYDQARSRLGGIGLTSLYALIDAGELHRVKIGRRAFLTAASLTEYVDRLVKRVESAAHAA